MNVLDASALLAFLFGEPGQAAVKDVISDCCMSTVNLSEVLGRFSRDGHDPHEAHRQIDASPIELIPFDAKQALLAAALLPQGLRLGLSLGDRACLALSIVRSCPVLTADRVWKELEVPVDIIQIRPEPAS